MPGGRPRAELNLDVVRFLADAQCTFEEMAGYLGVSVDTISRRYKDDPAIREIIDAARARGLAFLRRAMWWQAFLGSPPEPLALRATDEERAEWKRRMVLALDPKHRAIALKAQLFLSQQYLDMKSKHGIGSLDGGPLVDIDAALRNALERGLSQEEREKLDGSD